MALHVRISNHNLFKLLKLRLMTYAAQVHGEHSLEKKHLPNSANEDLIESDICHGGTPNTSHWRETHMYMRNTPCLLHLPDCTEARCLEYRCFRLSDCTHSGLHCGDVPHGKNTLHHDDPLHRDDALHCGEAHHCDSESQRTTSWPMSLLDVQRLLFSSEVLKAGNGADRLVNILKPIQHTSDDIYFNQALWHQPAKNDIRKNDIPHAGDSVRSISHTSGLACCDESVVLCDGSASKTEKSDSKKADKGPLPSEEQLRVVHDYFVNYLPQFFRHKLDFSTCHNDIIFENNYWGKNKIVYGVTAYASELNKIRFLALLKYTRVSLIILKITLHTEDGTVRVRWRISGLPQFRSLLLGRNLFSKNKDSDSVWHDGFSIFHVGKDGLIHKHRVDRVMPDEERQVSKSNSLATKLAILLGLSPKPSLSDFSALFMRKPALTVK